MALCACDFLPKSNLLLLLNIITVMQPKSVSWNLFRCPRSHLKNCLPLCDQQKLRRSSFTSRSPKTSSWPLTLGSVMAIASSLSIIKPHWLCSRPSLPAHLQMCNACWCRLAEYGLCRGLPFLFAGRGMMNLIWWRFYVCLLHPHLDKSASRYYSSAPRLIRALVLLCKTEAQDYHVVICA